MVAPADMVDVEKKQGLIETIFAYIAHDHIKDRGKLGKNKRRTGRFSGSP